MLVLSYYVIFLKHEVREVYKVLLDDDQDFVGFDTR